MLIVVFVAGCSNSTMRWNPSDPNSHFEFAGKAADTVAGKLAVVLANNAQTGQGRQNALFDSLKRYSGLLLLAFVGGLVFWGFTRSRYGWVIPASSVGGLTLISFWGKFATYITWGVMLVAISLLAWKAIEYQKERNNIAKKGEPK